MPRFQFLRVACCCLVLLAPGAGPLAAPAGATAYRLEVAGLSCPFCAYGIEKKLLALEGVERVEVHLKDGVVLVNMAEGSELDEATARKAVKDAGFTLGGFARVAAAEAGR